MISKVGYTFTRSS